MSEVQQPPLYTLGENKFDELLAEYTETAEAVEAENDPCGILAQFFSDLPMVAYIKAVQADGSLKMAWVNKAYENDVGITSAEYVACHDRAFWDAVTTAGFRENDQRVLTTGRAVAVAERAPNRSDPAQMLEWRGWKWPVIVGGKIIAICGYAVPSEVGADG